MDHSPRKDRRLRPPRMDVLDEDSIPEISVLKRLSVNTRLSAAKIFEEESNDSIKSSESNKTDNKMKSNKKNVKKTPYNVALKKVDIEYETDLEILERRQKQIDYGKNTAGYDNYRKLVPYENRKKDHPRTPSKKFKYSRRGWDGLIKTWRQKLHEYDLDEIDVKTEKTANSSDEEIICDFL